MMDPIFNHWPSALLLAMGVVYLLLIQYLSKREAEPRNLTELELLAKLARMGPQSEYDLFFAAAADWHISDSRVEQDFRTYLLEGRIPYYLNAYLRQIIKNTDNRFRPPFTFGGGSLPWIK